MSEFYEDWKTDQILNHGFNALALAVFLDKKGIINYDEFASFREKYIEEYFKLHYPDTPIN